jgi:hypothetical protein
MNPRLDALISAYENGVITRRELLGSLTASWPPSVPPPPLNR